MMMLNMTLLDTSDNVANYLIKLISPEIISEVPSIKVTSAKKTYTPTLATLPLY